MYGVWLVAVMVVQYIEFSTVWLLPFTLLYLQKSDKEKSQRGKKDQHTLTSRASSQPATRSMLAYGRYDAL